MSGNRKLCTGSAEGPAFIAIMPPAPETSQRWYSMYCRACGVEEMMAETEDDPRLIAHRDEHNRRHHNPTEPPSSENAYTGIPISEVIRSEQGEPSDAQREVAMDEAWGFRAETRPIQEKWNAQHWFDAGWRAALRAAGREA